MSKPFVAVTLAPILASILLMAFGGLRNASADSGVPCQAGFPPLAITSLTEVPAEGGWASKSTTVDGRTVFTLNETLVCKESLYILDPRITLDLNGFSVQYEGPTGTDSIRAVYIAGAGSLAYDPITKPPAARDVIVTSSRGQGEIAGFEVGVFIDHSDGNTLSNLTIKNNFGSLGSAEPMNAGAGFGDGILLRNSSHNKMEGNVVVSNGHRSGIRIKGLPLQTAGAGDDPPVERVQEPHLRSPIDDLQPNSEADTFTPTSMGNVIRGNVVLDTRSGTNEGYRFGAGIYLPPNAIGTTVEGNVIAGSSLDGISVSERYYQDHHRGYPNLQYYEKNRIVPAASLANEITNNAVLKNGFTGIWGTGNIKERKGDGIRLMTEGRVNREPHPQTNPQTEGGDPDCRSDPNKYECNLTTRLMPVPAHTLVEGNLVCDNAGNGISAGLGANTIQNNDVGIGSPVTDDVITADLQPLIAEGISALNVDDPLKNYLANLQDTEKFSCGSNGVKHPPDSDPKTYFDLSNTIVSSDSDEETREAFAGMESSCTGNTWSGNYTRGDRLDPRNKVLGQTADHLACTAATSDADVSVAFSEEPPEKTRANSQTSHKVTVLNAGPNRANRILLTYRLTYEEGAGVNDAGAGQPCPPESVASNVNICRHLGNVVQAGKAGKKVAIGLETLSKGESRTIEIRAVPNAPGKLHALAEVTASQEDPTTRPPAIPNDSQERTTTITPANFKFQVALSPSTPSGPVAGVENNLEVKVLDPAGNVAKTYRGTIGFSSLHPGDTTHPSEYTFTEGDDGVKSFKVIFRKAGPTWLRVEHADEDEDKGVGGQVDVTVKAGSPNAAKSKVDLESGTVPANGSNAAQVAVTLKDDFENHVDGERVSLLKTAGPGDLKINNPQTSEAGRARFALSTIRSGKYTVKAAVGNNNQIEIDQTADLTFVAGAVRPAKSRVSADRTSGPADGTTAANITVTLRDEFENPVQGKPISLSMTGGAGNPSITPSSATSNSSGAATFAVKSRQAGKHTFEGTSESIAVGRVDVTFLSGPVNAARSSISASPASVPADGTSASIVFVTLRDQNSNPVAGKTVSLSKTNGPGEPAIDPSSATSDSGGRTRFSITSRTPGKHTFAASNVTDSIEVGQIEIDFSRSRGGAAPEEDGSGENSNSGNSATATGSSIGSSASSNAAGTTSGRAQPSLSSGRRNSAVASSGSAPAATNSLLAAPPAVGSSPAAPSSAISRGPGTRSELRDTSRDATNEADTFGKTEGRRRAFWPPILLASVAALALAAVGAIRGLSWWRRRPLMSAAEADADGSDEKVGTSESSSGETDSSFSWKKWQASLTE